MFLKTIVLVACLVGVALGDSAPAFVWGSKSASRPSLQTLSQDEFADLLEPISKDTMIVAFLEPELSNSDFACKAKSEDSCYSNLKGVTPKTYYGSVQNPTEALRQISANREFAIINDLGDLENEIQYETNKVVFCSFEAPTEAVARDELLEFHDAAIAKVYNKLAKEGPITAVYTRTQSTAVNRSSRRRRETAVSENGNVFRSTNEFLLYYTTLALQTPPTTANGVPTVTPITITSMTLSEKNDTGFKVNLDGGSNKITFNINLVGGYFELSKLMLNSDAYYVLPAINAPTDFSYYSGNQTFSAVGSNNVILWNSFQIQAPFNSATANTFAFGDAWYQVGFVTPAILAGLFVVVILLGIVGLGICWMMDINTMDRFDDPKGKTITINVTD